MEDIKVYNTLTKKKEVFKPLTPGEAKIYVCGVTPYNHPHIGNARPAVTWDIIRRYLEYIGYKVTFVQNFTDVDDKIINKANAEGTDWKTISDRYIDAYFQVMDALHVRRADVYPRVSEHMKDIIKIMIFPHSKTMANCLVEKSKICWLVLALKSMMKRKIQAILLCGKLLSQVNLPGIVLGEKVAQAGILNALPCLSIT